MVLLEFTCYTNSGPINGNEREGQLFLSLNCCLKELFRKLKIIVILIQSYCDLEIGRPHPPQITCNNLVFNSSIPKGRGPFQEAYVFVVGGGNYIEYQNLQDYCQQQQIPKRITYGTTELMDATEFLAQVTLSS